MFKMMSKIDLSDHGRKFSLIIFQLFIRTTDRHLNRVSPIVLNTLVEHNPSGTLSPKVGW